MKKLKTSIIMLMISLMGCFVLFGCGSEETVEGKKAILVVSFGTSYNESREITIGAVENAIEENFADYEVRRAFTSQIIIDIIEERDGEKIDNVEEALDKLVEDGIDTLIVQPTHVMSGYEYSDVMETLESYEDKFEELSVGTPLLTSEEDYQNVIDVITAETAEYNNDDTAIVFMGHGTEHEANSTYSNLQEKITEAGYVNYIIGTVEAEPTLEEVIELIEAGGYTNVVLEPLMVVAGDHANNDMAGDEDDAWKTILTNDGYNVECVLKGLGQFEGIQNIYVAHVQAAIDALSE